MSSPSPAPWAPATHGNASAPPASPSPVASVTPGGAVAVPRRNVSVGAVVVWVLVALAGVVSLLLVAPVLAQTSGLVIFLAALIPLTVCIVVLRWLDHWDPEPWYWVLLALMWGAGASVILSLWGEVALEPVAASLGGDVGMAVYVAPVVEEVTKGLGLLILVAVAARHIYGPVDGIVYGGLIGAGFAFTENILYFAQASTDGALSLGLTFVVRGLFSPLAHVLFTAWTGAAVGWAMQRRRSVFGVFPAWLLGLIPAIIGHGLFNLAASDVLGIGFFAAFAITQVPAFVAAVFGCVWLARREASLMRRGLSDYAAAGWFEPSEVQLLATAAGRRSAKTWAGSRGAGPSMKNFIRTAAQLGEVRQLILTRGDTPALRAEENRLLHQSLSAREMLRTHLQAGAGGWTLG